MKNELSRKTIYPYTKLEELERDMEKMISSYWPQTMVNLQGNRFPSCDISEQKNHYMINVDLPGIPKDDINIELRDEQLHIFGERKSAFKEGNYTERHYGKFDRNINLPKNITLKDANAIFEDGVLTIALKKNENTKVKRLEISSEEPLGFWAKLTGEEKTNKNIDHNKAV